MNSKNNPVGRKKDLVVQELKGETLIYDLTVNKAFCLNETSALIYELCDGNRSVTEIKQAVSKRFKSSVSDDFIWLALEQLKDDNLLANELAENNTFKGLSRREAIKRVGLSSMLAIPVIASLTVSASAQVAAQSCRGAGALCSPAGFPLCCGGFTCRTAVVPNTCCANNGTSCNGDAQCCSGVCSNGTCSIG